MKKRDEYWLYRMLGFLAIILFFAGTSFYNIVQFNNSYMQEEKKEIEIFAKQIEWGITPYLKNNDIDSIKKYCEDFKDEDLSFRIFNEKKHLLAGSKIYNNTDISRNNSKILQKKYGKWKLYRHSIKDKMLKTVKEIQVESSKYYIELSISEEDVIKSIVEAQKSIFIFFAICMFLLVIGLFQVFYTLRKSYNKLEDSIIEVANGNLDYPITIPKNGLLKELTISIKTLIKRLKNQIIRLKQLEQYKTEFLQNITHEIKTPITAINSAIELIETNNSFSKTNKECFEIVKFQSKVINKLVNDILCLSELEVEKTKEHKIFRNFNFDETIKKTINCLGYTHINFHCEKHIEIFANEELLASAISNLLINAEKYSGSKDIDILLSQTESKIILKIQDYGEGIAPEHLDKIFDRFYRVDKARSRQTGGTGLGLAIVKNIIELHSGTINVTSKPNQGTTFTLEIPRIHNTKKYPQF